MKLTDITRRQDTKIRDYLDDENPLQFWYANCPTEGSVEEHMRQLHALGFDNYPVAQIPTVDALMPYLFFFERMLGAEVGSADGHAGDFFHSWCSPIIRDVADINGLSADPGSSPLWQAYEAAIRDHLRETPADEQLPVAFPGLSPLDMACNLCGAEQFFLLLYEESEAAERLLDSIVTLMLDVYRQVKSLGARVVSFYGFPGVYCNDLQLPSLSPSHVARFMLPCYARIAEECDGLLMALLSPSIEVLKSTLAVEGITGCAFDKRLPLSAIKEHLGRKLFIIPNYCYDDALDKPTYRDGIWWNPIVQSYSRELMEVYQEFVGEHSLLISIERPTLEEVCREREELQAGRRGR